ncbi:cyclin-dependent kinase F-4-like [Rosa chinensis]|uniref:cyclin-dependent kinase F-4-like n=1 Tax=Rosa chinensis TaxID=74649 RepID=UPI001AD8F95E|nr:cyclin-dependent kinase F-4-like [Rosa chinensis]
MWQSCYYVPPSLRPKLTTARTPPFAGTRGALEQQSARKVSRTLSSAKLTSSFPSPKLHASIGTGVQRKLDMANQDAKKNDKYLKSSANQQKYRPPGKSSPSEWMHYVE